VPTQEPAGQRASVGPDNIKAFRRAYQAARKAGQETFQFEDQEVLVDYAKYLLEYWDTQVDPRLAKGRRSIIQRVP